MVLGLFANEALARVLKHAMRDPRPERHCSKLRTCGSYGMPSSHVQCIAFAVVVHLLLHLHHWPRRTLSARMLALIEVAGLACIGGLVAVSRVYSGHHSETQVAVGAVVGICFGVAWSAAMHLAAPAFRAVAGWGPAGWLFVKDTWGVPEPLALERQAALEHPAGGGGPGRSSRQRGKAE